MSPPLPPKREVSLALLERSSVHVHLDPRLAGVVVPPWFKSQPQLVLQIGLNMPVPIPDLRLDEDGMSCTLSFNRSPFHCVIPWTSVFAMVGEDGRGMVWPDDLPPEVARQAAAAARWTAAAARGTGEEKTDKTEKTREEPVEDTLSKKRTGKKKPARPAAASAGAGASDEASDKASDRARLVAVPTPPASTPMIEASEPRERPSREPKTPRIAPMPSPSSPGSQAAQPAAPRRPSPVTPSAGRAPGKKRELPPYLRVVK